MHSLHAPVGAWTICIDSFMVADLDVFMVGCIGTCFYPRILPCLFP